MSDNTEDTPLEEEIEVQIEGDDATGEPEILKPEEGMDQLKRQLDAEIARRKEAERRTNDAERRAHEARMDKEDTDLQLVSGAIDTLDRDTEILKQNLQYAMQTGNHAQAVALQEEISDNKAKLLQLRNGYDAMKSKPKAPPPQPVHVDPVEAFLARIPTEPSRNWIRAHPDYVTDPAKNRKMIAAHELAVADGIAPDTPEYFASIEQTLRIRPQAQVVEEEASSGAAKVVQRRDAAPAAAPVSRGQPSSRNTMRLTKEQAEAAADMGLSPQKYAEYRAQLIKEGKIKA